MTPVGGVAGPGGREGGDVQDLRRPLDRTGLEQEHPAGAGRGQPTGQGAARRSAPDDDDVVLLTHVFSMAVTTDRSIREGWAPWLPLPI